MIEREYELKLSTGRVVRWVGVDADDAARRYVDTFRDAAVIATRPVAHGFVPGVDVRRIEG